MNENIISWNVANFITITLMALLGYFIFSAATQGIKTKTASAGA